MVALYCLLFAPPPAGVLHLRPVEEPKERAFSLLVPDGWRVTGGIYRVNPMMAGGPLNALGAKLDMTVEDPSGGIRLRWLPELTYVDPRRSPAGQSGMFPNGSNYNGATVWPILDAVAYLQQYVLRELHPGAQKLAVKNRYPLPQAAQSYARVTQAMGIPIQFRYDVSLLVVTYMEDGAAYEEALYTAIQDWGPLAAGLWNNKDTFAARAPAGALEKAKPLIELILSSARLNPAWVQGEIRGQMERGEIALRTQQDIQRLEREITENRRRTNSEINNQAFHTLMGTEEYVNPVTKKVEVGSNAWNYRWVNERGEAVYTDDASFDPVRAGLQGFVKSSVRKRFPER
jgi:hypothetical protein